MSDYLKSKVDYLVAVIVLAIVYVLVRPRSKGAELVTAVTGAMTAMVKSAVDLAASGGT